LQRKPPESLLEMGRVAGPYGVRGWVKVAPGGGAAESLAQAKEWWIGDRVYEVAAKVHGATVVAQLGGVATREAALALKGAAVSVRREALAEPGEGHYYHADLLGLEVVNDQGAVLGVIRRLFTNGAQDVMEVSGEGALRLLPWVPAVVKKVDLVDKRVLVEWGADW
jgi:16S rRNA processing protein RimM